MRPATPAPIEVGRQTHQAARPDAQEVWWDAERQCADRDQGRPCRSGAHQARWVRLAEDLAGPYDVIARVQAPSLDELGRLVVAHVQLLDGVTRTVICMALHR
jgi:hypothetical protein